MKRMAPIRSWSFLFFVTILHHVTSTISRTFTAKSGHLTTSALLLSGHVTTKIHCAQWCLTIKSCTSFDHAIMLCNLYREDGGKGGNSWKGEMFYLNVNGKQEAIAFQSTGPELIFTSGFGRLGHISLINNSLLGYSNLGVPKVKKLVYSSKLHLFIARAESAIVVFSGKKKCCKTKIELNSKITMINFDVDDRKGRIFIPAYQSLYYINLSDGKLHMKKGKPRHIVDIAVYAKIGLLYVCTSNDIAFSRYSWRRITVLHKSKNIKSCSFESGTHNIYFLSSRKKEGILSKLTNNPIAAKVVARLSGIYTIHVIYQNTMYFYNDHRIHYLDLRNPKSPSPISNVRLDDTTALCIKTKD